MKTEAEKYRELEKLAIQGMMSVKDYRSFMMRVLQQSGVFSETFDADPFVHANNSGRAACGRWLLNELKEAAPESYLTMIKEHCDE